MNAALTYDNNEELSELYDNSIQEDLGLVIDDMLMQYVEDNFDPSHAEVILKGIVHLNNFVKEYDFEPFINVISLQEVEDSSDNRSDFILMLEEELGTIFEAHKIKLVDNIELRYVVLMLDGLWDLQQAPEVSDLEIVLESYQDNIECTAACISHYTGEDLDSLTCMIAEVSPTLINNLKTLVELKSKISTIDRKDLSSLMTYFSSVEKKYKDRFVLGKELLEAGMVPFSEARLYIPFVAEYFNKLKEKSLHEELLLGLVTVSVLCKDGLKDPLEGAVTIFGLLFPDRTITETLRQELSRVVSDISNG